MSAIQPLFPRRPVPALECETVGGDPWRLSDQAPEHFTMVVFYRGLHCPICSAYLKQLHELLPDFSKRGVEVVAVSSDEAERATRTKAEWGLPNLTIGFGLDLVKAREWGLYVSTSRGMSSTGVVEPDRFSEPGLYLVRADGTLYFGTVQTMPFARPDFRTLLGAVGWVIDNDYPARGEVLD